MDQRKLLEEISNSLLPDSSPSPVPMVGVPVQEIVDAKAQNNNTNVVMGDEEITSILENHITKSQNWINSTISIDQGKAMDYYLGKAEHELAPPEVEDRSSIVDTVVSDQIEWLMPSLMEIFYASGNPVKFIPHKPGDEDAAEQMTHLVNHVVNEQNPGFEFMNDWFKNSLLHKVGVAKAWWQVDTVRKQENYTGLTDEQFAIICDDPEVTLTSAISYVDPYAERFAIDQYNAQMAAYQAQTQVVGNVSINMLGGPIAPPMAPQLPLPQPVNISKLPQLHDVVMTRSTKSGRVAIDALNPEDFIIAETSKRIEDGFCAHRIKKTISELRATGYKNVDDIESDEQASSAASSSVTLARNGLQDVFYTLTEDDGSGDESQRVVWLYECYLPMDCDGDGIAEWRKITKAGNVILDNEVCDGPPFAALCPVRIPGLFYGRSIADLAMPIQHLKTGMLRSLIDNVNLQVNGRTAVVEGQVNMDDLLSVRPGGIVRVKNTAAIQQLQQGLGDSAGAYQLLQYVDTMSQERTGITKYSQGLDSDSLNHTASGIENITQRADLRVKLIARTFAETGVKELFRLIQKLLANYQDQHMVFQLNGKWVNVDPRVWKNSYSMSVSVGTGTGDTGKRITQLTQLLGVQQQMFADPKLSSFGVVTAQNLFKTASELVHALQLGEPSQFFTSPVQPAPQPPAADPNQAVIQGQIQIAQAQAQAQQATDIAKIQAQDAANIRDTNLKAQLENQHESLLDQRERAKFEAELAWKREQFYAELALKREQAALAAKITDPQEEIILHEGIVDQQKQEELDAIDREFEIINSISNGI